MGEDSLGPKLKELFGGTYIANPDLPRRFAENAPLNEQHPETFYASGPVGDIDYPVLEAAPA